MLLFSIFGNPVTHSISPRLHNSVFQAFGIDACYTRVPILEPSTLIPTFHTLGLQGANVTVPHKEIAYQTCDEVRGIANKIGAVNTLVREGSFVIGYNTDAEGFYKAISSWENINNVLILGAGGTAKAIAMILRQNNIHVSILNRSHTRFSSFEAQGFTCYSWDTFYNTPYDLVINTTSAGLKDEEFPCPLPLLDTILSQSRFAFDVIYNKQTPFLKEAQKYNLAYKDGAEMLLYQAILAFNLFFGNRFDEAKIASIMRPTLYLS